MPLVYITGPTGSGKSTACQNLEALGYETYDTDKNGIRYWIDPNTGESIKEFKKGEVYDNQWMNDHQLGLPKSWLENLKSKSMDKPVFVCGTSPIDHTESNIFDKIIVLTIDDKTLINRINERTNNSYGKQQDQLDKALKWRQPTIDRYLQAGAIEIDSTLPVNTVIDKILDALK